MTSPQIRFDENIPPAGGGLYVSDSQSLRRGSVPVEFSYRRKYSTKILFRNVKINES